MIRIKIDTKRVECIMYDTYHAWYIWILNAFQLNFRTKKEPQKLNGNLLNSIVRTVVSVTNVNYRPFYGLFEAW